MSALCLKTALRHGHSLTAHFCELTSLGKISFANPRTQLFESVAFVFARR
jgi:hypothetical protein